MTPEELLKPRYKVIADYPGCSCEVGTILIPDESGELMNKKAGYSWSVTRVLEKDVKKFSHLVQKLEWFQERKPEEMPEYVKSIPEKKGYYEVKKVKQRDGVFIEFDEKFTEWRVDHCLPATLEEYNAYQSSIKDTTTLTNKIK